MKLLVINLDIQTGPGTHWVGLIEFPKQFEYFDSYGMDAPQEVTHFIGSKPMYYNNDQMQSLTSEKCGWFVLYWAWLRLVAMHDRDIVEPEYINEISVKNSNILLTVLVTQRVELLI